MAQSAVCGNHGPNIRSDCRVELSLTSSGGISLSLESKVAALYGRQIEELAGKVLSAFGITDAELVIRDSGALDFVLAARLEAAVKNLTGSDNGYLLPAQEQPERRPAADRRRYHRLYIPGNTPRMMINAGIHKPDGIILDLEDSVAPEKKREALILVRNALRSLDFMGAERMVRINQLPAGLQEVAELVPHGPEVILIPKCESARQVHQVNQVIKELTGRSGDEKKAVMLMPIIESAKGIEEAYPIATAADNLVGLALGLEDLTADLGVSRTIEGTETLYARSRLVNACRAAGIQAIDSVFSDVADTEGLKQTVACSRALGFSGMGCIHPRQIQIITRGYAPDQDEISKARDIVAAYRQAKKEGRGVVALGSKMIDPPVVKRARRILEEAGEAGHNVPDTAKQDESS